MSNTQKSQIINKLKTVSKGAWKRSRAIDAKARGGGGLPPNLKGVVAACQTYRMAQTNTPAKDPYFMLTCIIKDPEELVGRKVTFMWFINDSEYATVEDNLNLLSNDLQLLGMDMPEDIGDVVDVLADLCERGVHLIFNTGAQPKNANRTPKPYIQGLAEDWPDEPQEGAGEAEGKSSSLGKGKAKPANKNQKGKPADTEEEEEAAEEAEETTEEVEEKAAEETTESSDEPWIPQVDDEYSYKGKKAVVVKVDEKKKTFDLKTGKPPKVIKGIKWWKDKNETEANVESL